MDDKKARILDKIKKLFRLGASDSGGTEAEIELAVTRARELMAAHNIAVAELEALGDDADANAIRFNIQEHTAYTRKVRDFAPYDYYVVAAVNNLCNTRSYVQHHGHTLSKLVFLGDVTDVAVAVQLFTILLQSVRRCARGRYGSPRWTAQHTSYCIGFGLRLIHRSKEMIIDLSMKDRECVALVLRSKDVAIAQFMDTLNLRVAKPRAASIDAYAHQQGYIDGAALSLQKDRTMR